MQKLRNFVLVVGLFRTESGIANRDAAEDVGRQGPGDANDERVQLLNKDIVQRFTKEEMTAEMALRNLIQIKWEAASQLQEEQVLS